MKADEKQFDLSALITRVREGDQQAFAELLEAYTPLVQATVAYHAGELGDFDREDLRQAALLALYRAALSFDLSQSEVKFGLYAKICMTNAISTQLRAIRRRSSEISVPDGWQGERTATSDPAERIMAEEAFQSLRMRIRALLSPFENHVWNLFTAGLGVKEIAERLEKEPRSIENAIYRIRQKLRAGLGEGDR